MLNVACLAGQEQAAVEELRVMAQYQFAVHPSRILGVAVQKIVNSLLDGLAAFLACRTLSFVFY